MADLARSVPAQHHTARRAERTAIRTRWSPPRLDDGVAQDFKAAVRGMRSHRVVSAVVVLTLALAIGLLAAVASLVDGILLRPLPFIDPDRLVRLWSIDLEGSNRFLDATFADFEVFRTQDAFASMAAFSLAPRTLRDARNTPANAVVGRIAGPLFAMIGARPVVGRDFTEDEVAGGARVALLSHDVWQRRYGGAADIVGEPIRIDETAYTVLGVLPPSYAYPREVDLWRPFGPDEYQDDDRELLVIARLAPGATAAYANQQLGAVASARALERPDTNAGFGAWVQPLHETIVGDVRPSLWLLTAAVAGVLLIVCANVAGLLLARGTAQAHEMGIRSALGAGGARLARQVALECLLMVAAGGLLGLVLGGVLLDVVVAATPAGTPRIGEVRLDLRVGLAVLGISALVAFAFGVPSAWRAARIGGGTGAGSWRGCTLPGGLDPRIAAPRGAARMHAALVGVQLATSTALVISAVLLIASFRQQAGADRGFDPTGVIVVRFEPPAEAHLDPRDFVARVTERIAAIGGVESVAAASAGPTERWGYSASMLGIGGLPEASTGAPAPIVRTVTPGYFRSVGTPLLAGREIAATDREGAPLVALVNRAFVNEILAGREPVGFRLTATELGDAGEPAQVEIVGVFADVVAELGTPARPMIVLSGLQVPLGLSRIFVGTTVPAASVVADVRRAFWEVDDTVALDTELLAAVVAESVAEPRFRTTFVVIFSTVALLLAAIGVYGVVSYSVAARTREIGVRRALGVTSRGIFLWTLRRWTLLAAAGIGGGIVGALALGGLLSRFLYGVAPTDPAVYVGSVLLLAAAATFACMLPARRAARVDPIVALRAD